jgi:hypothetical protein
MTSRFSLAAGAFTQFNSLESDDSDNSRSVPCQSMGKLKARGHSVRFVVNCDGFGLFVCALIYECPVKILLWKSFDHRLPVIHAHLQNGRTPTVERHSSSFRSVDLMLDRAAFDALIQTAPLTINDVCTYY